MKEGEKDGEVGDQQVHQRTVVPAVPHRLAQTGDALRQHAGLLQQLGDDLLYREGSEWRLR